MHSSAAGRKLQSPGAPLPGTRSLAWRSLPRLALAPPGARSLAWRSPPRLALALRTNRRGVKIGVEPCWPLLSLFWGNRVRWGQESLWQAGLVWRPLGQAARWQVALAGRPLGGKPLGLAARAGYSGRALWQGALASLWRVACPPPPAKDVRTCDIA